MVNNGDRGATKINGYVLNLLNLWHFVLNNNNTPNNKYIHPILISIPDENDFKNYSSWYDKNKVFTEIHLETNCGDFICLNKSYKKKINKHKLDTLVQNILLDISYHPCWYMSLCHFVGLLFQNILVRN